MSRVLLSDIFCCVLCYTGSHMVSGSTTLGALFTPLGCWLPPSLHQKVQSFLYCLQIGHLGIVWIYFPFTLVYLICIYIHRYMYNICIIYVCIYVCNIYYIYTDIYVICMIHRHLYNIYVLYIDIYVLCIHIYIIHMYYIYTDIYIF